MPDLGLSSYSFDVEAIRRDFPILRERVNGHPLIWLDNGATTQKPQSDGLPSEEIGDYLNRKGIAVRGGHHCAQPILRRFGLESTARATFALYNTIGEVDTLLAALWDLRQGRGVGLA